MDAGPVGCYYGSMLARAGHEVVLIARPSHIDAIVRDGLRMQTTSFDGRVALVASSEPGAVQSAQLLLFCVKSLDTELAGPRQVRHHGRGELVIEPSRASEAMAQALFAAGVPTEISDWPDGAGRARA